MLRIGKTNLKKKYYDIIIRPRDTIAEIAPINPTLNTPKSSMAVEAKTPA